MIVLILLLSAQVAAGWLDRAPSGWNQPAAGVPPSRITADAQATLERRCGSPKSASPGAIDAIRRARWVPFLHLDQAIASNDTEVLGGMTGATPGCEPLDFNLFVFAGGVFVGTVSSVMMAPTRDGAAGAVRITGADALSIEFARYVAGDSECCPSSRVRVSYRIDRTGASPTLIATGARQVR